MNVAIVNDMPLAVECLRRVLALKPDCRIVWIAENGAEAVRRCNEQQPDIVLMDLLMPEMDGVEATRRIMASTPCAILIVTAHREANVSRVFDAMGHGALDVVDMPALGNGDVRHGGAPLLAKLDIIGKLVGDGNRGTPAARLPAASYASHLHHLVAVGSSAGGPSALAVMLRGLPADFPAPIVIVQHVDEQFSAGMAQWLAQHASMPVRVARDGDSPTAGEVLLAGTNHHLYFAPGGGLAYTRYPEASVYRPSVDVFFESACERWPGPIIGVLLTGMGRDGALGLKALRDKGHYTIAQNRATCAVYGMPKAAIALDAAVDVLPIEAMARRLREAVSTPREIGTTQ